MQFSTKIAIVVAEDLPIWQKLNVVSFLTSGIVGSADNIIGEAYLDASQQSYLPLCVQPAIILQAERKKLNTFIQRAQSRGISAAIFIEDMFSSGHDEANRATVNRYDTEALPLVGIALRAEAREVDKVTKGAKLHP